MNVAAEVANLKIERADLAMLEALEAAPEKTLRWEDRMEAKPIESAFPGGPRRTQSTVVQGLQGLANDFCESRPDLTVFQRAPIIEEKGALRREHPLEPYTQRCDIARLERLVMVRLIEHMDSPDEETAKQPTRSLRLTVNGAEVLKNWRKGAIPGVPHPDPKPPSRKPAKLEAEPDTTRTATEQSEPEVKPKVRVRKPKASAPSAS